MTEIPARLNAALEGRYVVERQLGEGGMATVYLARDLKHDRNVALKVLKPELAAVVGAERFLAEIQTTAKLQHPHILPLHDSGEADAFLYYVMPYVEGESLRERLDRERQLPVDESVRIATDLAEALDYAHRQGVIHRDIKPANVMMHEGRPLIADFGIALAVGAAGASRLTETGLSVGTPYYMSPEQATGDTAVGPQSDTYSLGCVLYEMLTGDPPYIGSTAQAVLGKIIQGEPVSATAVRKSVPANVDGALRKALEKLPADRFGEAQSFARALADPAFRHGTHTDTEVAAAARPWNRLSVALAATTVAFAAAFVWSTLNSWPEAPQPVERFASPFLDGQAPVIGASSDEANAGQALSSDGSFLVYRGPLEPDGARRLWMRRWNTLEAFPIRGTEGASRPSPSPDGLELAFVQEGDLRVLPLQGGPARTLLSDVLGGIIVWGSDGHIYSTTRQGLVKVPTSGGEAEVLYRTGSGELFVLTDVLPGAESGLAMWADATSGSFEMRVVDLGSGQSERIGYGMAPRYTSSGHLLFLGQAGENGPLSLMGARFDADASAMSGQPVLLVEGVDGFSISRTGKLFYLSEGATPSLLQEAVWVTRDGRATPVEAGWTFDRGNVNAGLSLSPDGAKLAVRAMVDRNLDIWIKDLTDGSYTRLTRSEGEERYPRWTPDGERVTYVYFGGGHGFDVLSRAANGTGEAEVVHDHEGPLAQGFFSPDGAWIILRTIAAAGESEGREILALRVGVDSVAIPLLTGEYAEGAPALSPDTRWLAYNSDETGRYEVFVRPFPDVEADKIAVSTGGGVAPLWAHSGRELFYVDADRNVIAARVETEPSFRVVSREPLFQVPAGTLPAPNGWVAGQWDIAPDDQRFLMVRRYAPAEGAVAAEEGLPPPPRFILVQNFSEELRQRLGG